MKKLFLSLMLSMSVFLTACGYSEYELNDDLTGTYEGADGAYGDFSVSDNSEEKFAVSVSESEEFSESEESSEPQADEYSEPDSISEIEIETESEPEEAFDDYSDDTYVEYSFRTKNQLTQHFQKHGSEFGDEFGYETAEDYEQGASDVINSPDALYKTEAEDGDGVYYIEETNEFVILSTDGYIRTYFRPTAGKSYFDRQ